MAKSSTRLKKDETEKMFYKLCLAISKIKKPNEVASFLGDLLTENETVMISKRLKIAEMILDGFLYEEIREELRVGYSTIARVQEWLAVSGEGYRKAVESSKNKDIFKKEVIGEESLRMIKRKYSMHYWPEVVLENIIKNSNKKQKDSLIKIIKEMDKTNEKTELYKKIKKLTRNL